MFNRFGKASYGMRGAWRCATLFLVVASAGISASLSGCGGGSGGGGATIGGSNLANVDVTFQLIDKNGAPADGTVTFNAQTIASQGTRAVFEKLKPGTYSVKFQINGEPAATTATVVIGDSTVQNFALISGVTTVNAQNVSISGVVQLNTGNAATNNCTVGSDGISAPLLLQVIDVNDPEQKIVATVTKPDQSSAAFSDAQRGRYVINNLPFSGKPVTYRVEARQVPGAVSPFAGRSASFTVTSKTFVTGIDICANASNTPPGDLPDAG